MRMDDEGSDGDVQAFKMGSADYKRMDLLPVCPNCGLRADRQVRAGLFNGRQRYKCMACSRRYTLDKKTPTLTIELRGMLAGLHRAGLTPSQLAEQIGVDVRTVKSWLAKIAESNAGSTSAPMPGGSSATASPSVNSLARPLAYRRPTIGQVAERAGVSITTVSNFLNKKAKMSSTTHSKIQSAIDGLSFRPNALMKAIRENRTGIISVVLFASWSLENNLGSSILPPILTGIDRGGEESNLDILLCTNWSGSSRISADRFLGGHIDGLLWVAPGISEPVLDQVAGEGLPVVALLTRHVPGNVGYVNVDNCLGIKMAVDHLVDTGRSKIAYLGPVYNSNFLDRRDGFVEAIASHRIYLPSNYLMTPLYLPGYSVPVDDYYTMLERLLRSENRPDAVLCADDGLALEALTRIKAWGLRCPQDVAVTGFNDVPDASAVSGGLTTLKQPFNNMAAAAVKMLKSMIDGNRSEKNQLTLPPKLVCRGSTA